MKSRCKSFALGQRQRQGFVLGQRKGYKGEVSMSILACHQCKFKPQWKEQEILSKGPEYIKKECEVLARNFKSWKVLVQQPVRFCQSRQAYLSDRNRAYQKLANHSIRPQIKILDRSINMLRGKGGMLTPKLESMKKITSQLLKFAQEFERIVSKEKKAQEQRIKNYDRLIKVIDHITAIAAIIFMYNGYYNLSTAITTPSLMSKVASLEAQFFYNFGNASKSSIDKAEEWAVTLPTKIISGL